MKLDPPIAHKEPICALSISVILYRRNANLTTSPTFLLELLSATQTALEPTRPYKDVKNLQPTMQSAELTVVIQTLELVSSTLLLVSVSVIRLVKMDLDAQLILVM